MKTHWSFLSRMHLKNTPSVYYPNGKIWTFSERCKEIRGKTKGFELICNNFWNKYMAEKFFMPGFVKWTPFLFWLAIWWKDHKKQAFCKLSVWLKTFKNIFFTFVSKLFTWRTSQNYLSANTRKCLIVSWNQSSFLLIFHRKATRPFLVDEIGYLSSTNEFTIISNQPLRFHS